MLTMVLESQKILMEKPENKKNGKHVDSGIMSRSVDGVIRLASGFADDVRNAFLSCISSIK